MVEAVADGDERRCIEGDLMTLLILGDVKADTAAVPICNRANVAVVETFIAIKGESRANQSNERRGERGKYI
jgi:hypothetical protein